MILLLSLLCSIWGEPSLALEEDRAFSFEGDLQQLSVSHDSVYISTEEKLYQLSHNLILIHSLNLRGILKNPRQQNGEEFHRVSMNEAWDATFNINVLLPFVKKGTLIICGVADKGCGYCEVLDLRDISKLVYREHMQVGPQRNSRGSVSVLVDVKKDSVRTETYILTAIQNHREKREETKCRSDLETINLQNTDQKQSGGMFSVSDEGETPNIQTEADVDFVDGFQINSTVFLFSNVAPGAKTNKVRLIWLQAETSKAQTLKSLGGVTLSSSYGGEGSRLLASSLIPGGQQVLWSGVFSLDGGETNTELLLFDISPDQSRTTDTDPDFYYSSNKPNKPLEPVALKPKAKLFRKNHMSSVLAVRLNGWMVFFIGTTDGQLIKLAIDRNYQPACPKILYRTSGDNRVFPKIHLDPVDQKHVYVAFKNQVKHVSVSTCSAHQHVKDCLSAQDPFCVWCLTEGRCKFEGDCKDGEWFSIPDESKQKIVSHIVMQDSTGAIKLIIQTHLTVEQKVQYNFACQFSTSSTKLCKETGPQPQYPQCTCILKDSLPTDDLIVGINIRLGGTILADQIKISNCSNITGEASFHLCQRCIRAGCGWRQNRCSWGSDPIQKESICENMEFGKNFFKPEISSVSPSVVSFYGINHAVLSGHNLRDVTRVRIQDNMGCDTKESPVLSNNGSSLSFHIPSTEKKGIFKVCVLLPDGSCHGHLTITYQSSPICTDIVPPSTWTSGKRKLTLIGTNLDLVEGITHKYTQQKVIPLRRSSFQNLIYETTAETNAGMLSSPVFLKVANQSLKCKKEIIYYPDPKFTSYTAVREGKDIRITIQKEPDKLEMKPEELQVWVIQGEKQHQCIEISKKSGYETESFICVMEGLQNFKQIKIRYGGKTIHLWELSFLHRILLIIRLLLIPCIIAVLVKICWWSKRLTAETNHL